MVISLAQAYTLVKVLKRLVMKHSSTEDLTLNANCALAKVIHQLKLMRIELAFKIG